MLYALILCFIIIGILAYKLSRKQVLDSQELSNLKEEIAYNRKIEQELNTKLLDLQIKCNDARNDRLCEETHTKSLQEAANTALEQYHNIVDIKMKELDATIEEQRQKRTEDLNLELTTKEQLFQELIAEKQQYAEDMCNNFEITISEAKEKAEEQLKTIQTEVNNAQLKFDGIQHTLRQYDAEQQAKLYYTIQLPEEYQEDIEFLLTTVAAKVQHPDIISKLVWAEYVKPNLDATFKRIEIKAEPGIYKLTSLLNGKCYIGKSTNVKTRIADHYKSSVGIQSIADQAVHHAIRKEGFWNWTIEIITYCDKEQLSDLEKYYIDFFKAQDYGYNRNSGG